MNHQDESPVDEAVQRHGRRFLKTLWITKGARFESNRRLRKKNELSLYVQSILSIYVIAASAVSLMLTGLSPTVTQVLPLASLITTVFILVLMHLEAAKLYGIRAERMLRCAQRISEIHARLELELDTGSATVESVARHREQYHEVLRDFPENHSNADFFHFASSHRKAFRLEGPKGLARSLVYKAKYYLDIWRFYTFLLVLPPLLVVLILP